MWMFTGIVEETGRIEKVMMGEKSSRIRISARKVLEGTRIGDSISTNGVCLTVVQLSDRGFEADVMAETYRRSNLGTLRSGSRVNLERALTLNTRLGGHLVSGHIDGIGKVISKDREGNAVVVRIETQPNVLRHMIEKGSVALDGISLTIVSVTDTDFSVSIIPQTGSETTLLTRQVGDSVNIETDMIGKYVERLLYFDQATDAKGTAGGADHGSANRGLSEEFLRMNGFL